MPDTPHIFKKYDNLDLLASEVPNPGDWLIRESRAFGALSITFRNAAGEIGHRRYAFVDPNIFFPKKNETYSAMYQTKNPKQLKWTGIFEKGDFNFEKVTKAIEEAGLLFTKEIAEQKSYEALVSQIMHDYPKLSKEKQIFPKPESATKTEIYARYTPALSSSDSPKTKKPPKK
ncbi:MAG TPA: hypothetical protein VJ205_03605 [Gammaproteobacteria bacterium]|nr:hypothetical protein [Gammaproteobacteria bacterium]